MPAAPRNHLFETVIGRCAVVWTGDGIIGTQLPMAGRAEAERRLAQRFPGAAPGRPPPSVAAAIKGMIALLAGEPIELSAVQLDFAGIPAFEAAIYRALRLVPAGETITYGELAKRIGRSGAARAVGKAMGDNPWPILVPCHRVVGADGKAGGFSAPGGVATKARLLTIERARTGAEPMLFDNLAISVKTSRRQMANVTPCASGRVEP